MRTKMSLFMMHLDHKGHGVGVDRAGEAAFAPALPLAAPPPSLLWAPL